MHYQHCQQVSVIFLGRDRMVLEASKIASEDRSSADLLGSLL